MQEGRSPSVAWGTPPRATPHVCARRGTRMIRIHPHRAAPLLGALLSVSLAACDPLPASGGITAPDTPALAVVPAKGTAATLDVAGWNIEWFGSTGGGPTNEPLQMSNAKDIIAGTDF